MFSMSIPSTRCLISGSTGSSCSSKGGHKRPCLARASTDSRARAVDAKRQNCSQQLGYQVVAAAAAALLTCSSSAYAATADVNFATKCLGCHVNGGNIVQAGATLFQEDLVKNGVGDADSLYKLVYSGKGRMPGFGQECAPRGQCTFGPRLTDEEVQELVQYVQDKAAAGWKQ